MAFSSTRLRNNFQKFELDQQAIMDSVACTALPVGNSPKPGGRGRACNPEANKWKTPPGNRSSTGLTNCGSKPESPMVETRSSIIRPNRNYGTRTSPLLCELPTTFSARSDNPAWVWRRAIPAGIQQGRYVRIWRYVLLQGLRSSGSSRHQMIICRQGSASARVRRPVRGKRRLPFRAPLRHASGPRECRFIR